MLQVISGKPVRMRPAWASLGGSFCLGLLLFVGLAGIFTAPANASYMYDQQELTSQIVVDKQLKTAELDDWQDNIPASQLVLDEGNLLDFRIKIKNTGDKELKNINAQDFLPTHLEVVFHPGEFNEDENQINWTIDSLSPGDEKTITIRTTIQKSDQEVIDGTLCLINKAEARAESGRPASPSQGGYDQDTASFCIVAAKKLPKAGSGTNNLVMGTGIAGLFALTGITLRKFGRGKILA